MLRRTLRLGEPLLLARYISSSGDPCSRYAFDLAENGRIDRFDYAVWRRRIGIVV